MARPESKQIMGFLPIEEKHVFYATNEGTPQGGIISPVLANMVLDGLGTMLKQHYPLNSRKHRRAKLRKSLESIK